MTKAAFFLGDSLLLLTYDAYIRYQIDVEEFIIVVDVFMCCTVCGSKIVWASTKTSHTANRYARSDKPTKKVFDLKRNTYIQNLITNVSITSQFGGSLAVQ